MRTAVSLYRGRRPETVAALCLVAIVAIFQTAAIFLMLGAQGDAAHILDISGAQRMRSQELAYYALALHHGTQGETTIREKIDATVADLEAARSEIARQPLYLSGPRDEKGQTALGKLSRAYVAAVRAVERDPRDPAAYARVRRLRPLALAAYDAAVKHRVAVSNARLDELAAALLLGLSLQIASIAGVWVAIVLPAEKRSERALADFRHAQEEIESTFAGNPDAISVYDSHGRLVRINSSRAKLLGHDAKTLGGRHFSEFVSADQRAIVARAFERALAGQTFAVETKLVAGDGSLVDVSVSLFPRYLDGAIAGVNIVSKDLRGLRAAEAANAEQSRRLADLYEIASAYGRTPDELLHSALGLLAARLGYDYGTLTEIEDDTVTVVSTFGNPAGVSPGDRYALRHSLAKFAVDSDGVFEAPDFQQMSFGNSKVRAYGWRSVAGMKIAIEGKLYGTIGFASRNLRPAPLSEADTGFIRLACALLGTIVERGRQLRKLDSLAYSDSLTGLANRAQFVRNLNDFVALGTPFALDYVDLDRFKKVNDRFGHSVGDLVLGVSAKRLSHCVRAGDIVARLGGDEFAILQMGPAGSDAAEALAARIVEAFSEPIDLGGIAHDVGASVGVALFPAHAGDARGLIDASDAALYRAKRGGRRRTELFASEREELATA